MMKPVLTYWNKAACQNLMQRAEKRSGFCYRVKAAESFRWRKQRLSVARALLRRPHLMVFDEATSALDSITEEEILDTIRQLSTKKEHHDNDRASFKYDHARR